MAERYGLVLEQDYVYDIAFSLTKENTEELFDYYSKYANLNFIDNLEFGSFYFSKTSTNKEQVKNAMKEHILKYGAVTTAMTWAGGQASANINGYDLRYKVPNSSGSGGHAVTIIGWDDNVVVEDEKTGLTFTGAWIALNSFSNKVHSNGNEGIIYLLYDDTNFWGSYYGYKYNPKTTEDIYMYSKIEESNAYYETDKKGAVYGDYVGKNAETKQKNIFFEQNDVNLTYSYIISDYTKIDDISICSYGKDVTKLFQIDIDEENKEYKICGNDIGIGSYKVVVKHSNSLKQDEIINCFYVLNGTEINLIDYECSDGEFGTVNNNGFYQHFNNFNYIKDDITYGTSKTQGVLGVDLIFATYHKVDLIKTNVGENKYEKDNYYRAYINYDTSVTNDYEIELTSTSGVKRIIHLSIINPKDDQSLLTKVVYNLNDGDDSANYSKIFVSSSQEQKTYLNDAVRKGYWFKGWFYDESLEEELDKDEKGYFASYDNLIQYPTDTIYYTWRYGLSYRKSCLLYVYAKWEAKEEFHITASCDDHGIISYLGDNLVYDQDCITYYFVPEGGHIISKIVVDDVELSENEIYNALTNGYTFNNISSNHTISVEFEENSSRIDGNKDGFDIYITIIIPVCACALAIGAFVILLKKKII